MKHFFVGLALTFLTTLSASAQQDLHQLETDLDQFGWNAIGRLDMGNSRCTASLIATDIAITAAHCLYTDSGQLRDPKTIRFNAGYRAGDVAQSQGIRSMAIDETYAQEVQSGKGLTNTAYDVALLRLDGDIYLPDSAPFETTFRLPYKATVSVGSYGQGRMESIQLERECAHLKKYSNGVMSFNCNATFGSSGSPILVKEHGKLKIVSILVSISKDRSNHVAYGMALENKLPALMRSLNRQDAAAMSLAITNKTGAGIKRSQGAKRIGTHTGGLQGGARSSGGALFVRP